MTAAMRLRLSLVLSALWFLGLVLWPRDYFEADVFLVRLAAGTAAIFVAIYGAAWVFAPARERPGAAIPQWAIVAICLVIMVVVLGLPKLLIR